MKNFLTHWLVIITLAVAGVSGQTLTVTSPSAGQAVTGFAFPLTVSCTSCTALAYVSYAMDTLHAGISQVPPYTVTVNPYNWMNGRHEIIATGYDALGNIIAASAPVDFTNANNMPGPAAPACVPQINVSTSTPLSSNWSGVQTLTVASTGCQSTSTPLLTVFVDGISQPQDSNQPSGTVSFDTRKFNDGSHVVAVNVIDGNGTTGYYQCNCSPTNQGAPAIRIIGQWSRQATFLNAPVAVAELRTNAREIFGAPGSTFELSCTAYNTDGSTTSPTCAYQSLSGSCTVSGTGLVTLASSVGNCSIIVVDPQYSGSNLVMASSVTHTVTSPTHSFIARDIDQYLNITGGTGWTPGVYPVTAISSFASSANLGGTLAAANGTAGGVWQFGVGRLVYVFVDNSNVVPHFLSNGSVSTSYVAGQSTYELGAFENSNPSASLDATYPQFFNDYAASAFNAVEESILQGVTLGTNQSTFAASLANALASSYAVLNPLGLAVHAIGDPWLRGTPLLYVATQGPSGQTWNPTGGATIMQAWINSGIRVLGASLIDEVNSSWDARPGDGPFTVGTNGFTQIVCTSGTTCQVYWTNWSTICCPQSIMIRGVTSNTTLNSTPSVVDGRNTITSIDANDFTFTNPGVGTATFDSTTDPGMTIEPYVAWWFDSSGNACAPGDTCSGGVNYIHWNAFQQIYAQSNAVTGRMKFAWPPAQGGWNSEWTSATNVSDFNVIYWTRGGSCPITDNYLANVQSANALMCDVGNSVRSAYGDFGALRAAPYFVESTMTGFNFGLEGYPATITSQSGPTITFPSDHGIRNILSGITRLWITGGSNSALNSNYYIDAAPDNLHLTVSLASIGFSQTVVTGTVHFSNGDTFSNVSFCNTACVAGSSNVTVMEPPSSACAAGWYNHRGMTFTVSGTGTAFDTNTFLFTPDTAFSGTCGFTEGTYRELPTGTSTGGSAEIVPDNTPVRGRNFTFEWNTDPANQFATDMYAVILRASGKRAYAQGVNYNAWTPQLGFSALSDLMRRGSTNFGTLCNYVYEGDMNGRYPAGDLNTLESYNAHANANLMTTRLVPYLYGSTGVNLPSPDCGFECEAAARAGARGNLLMAINLSNNTRAFTFTLAPYLQSGQQIVRFYATALGISMTTLSAGTSSDTIIMDQEGFVAYLFPTAFASELQQPMISVRLADVPNATTVAVVYNYQPYLLDQTIMVFDCGSGSCTLPVDRQIGTVYYRLRYLDAAGNVLATSATQTL